MGPQAHEFTFKEEERLLFQVTSADEINDLRVTRIKVLFGGEIPSAWLKLAERPPLDEFVERYNHLILSAVSENSSHLCVVPQDVEKVRLSFAINFLFPNDPKGDVKIPRRDHDFPIEAVLQGEEEMKKVIQNLYNNPHLKTHDHPPL